MHIDAIRAYHISLGKGDPVVTALPIMGHGKEPAAKKGKK